MVPCKFKPRSPSVHGLSEQKPLSADFRHKIRSTDGDSQERLALLKLNHKTMNKEELLNKIAEEAGITKAQAKAALDSFTDGVKSSLKQGGKVSLVGFGTFSKGHRAARTGRNPQTGASVEIAAKNTVKFKAGKELSEYIN